MSASGSKTYLVLEIAASSAPDTPAADLARLKAALDEDAVASVLFVPRGESLPPVTTKALIELAQRRGAAAILADDAALARTLRADGVHLMWSKDQKQRFETAREILGERYIIGADAGRSRHDAMVLAESGASYVGFGIPAHVEDRDTAFRRQLGLVGWWSEIFEFPCVAFDVPDTRVAEQLAAAGADFLALTLPPDTSTATAASLTRAFAAALSGAKAGT